MLNLKDGTLWQWDTGRKILITLDKGFTIDKVQFYNGIGDNAYPGTIEIDDSGAILAAIPNSLLCYANNLTVYLMTTDEDGVKTQEQITLVVNRRAKPEDYIFTDDEFHTYQVYEERLKYLENNIIIPDKLEAAVELEVEKEVDPQIARIDTLTERMNMLVAPASGQVVTEIFPQMSDEVGGLVKIRTNGIHAVVEFNEVLPDLESFSKGMAYTVCSLPSECLPFEDIAKFEFDKYIIEVVNSDGDQLIRVTWLIDIPVYSPYLGYISDDVCYALADNKINELADIRVGANGTTYLNAGEAVRGQFTEINESAEDIAWNIYNMYEYSENRMHWSYDDVTQNAYLESDGTIVAYNDWWISTFLEVEPNTEYVYIKNWAEQTLADGVYYNCFDVNKNFISGANGEVITTTSNTAYIRVSLKNSYFNGGCSIVRKELYEQGLTNFIPYSKTFIPTKELNIVVNQLLTDVENINTNLDGLNNLATSTEKVINTLGEYAQPNYDKNVRAIQRIGEVGSVPHHSILGFTTAYKLGFRILLCDLMFTSDNVPVCFHDESINKNYTDVQYSDGTDVPKELNIKIKEHTYEELSVYDYGSYQGEEFKGYPLLKFTDMLKLVKHLGVELYVEIKEMTEEQSIIALDLVKSYGLEKSVTWCGNRVTAGYIKNLSDTARLGITPNELTASTINSIAEFKNDKNDVFIFGWNTWILTKDLVNLMKEKNINYEIGTINTSDGINEYFEQDEAYNYCTGVESNTIIAGKVILESIIN